MKFLLTVLILLIVSSAEVFAQPEIYIFRHGEKLEPWNTAEFDNFQPLSDKGRKTAENISKIFSDITVTAVYSSKTTRTLSTAWPLSVSKNIKIRFNSACSDTTAIGNFLSELSKTFSSDDKIVIISHSNIIPYFLIKTGIKPDQYPDYKITYAEQYASYLTNTFNYYWVLRPVKNGTADYSAEMILFNP